MQHSTPLLLALIGAASIQAPAAAQPQPEAAFSDLAYRCVGPTRGGRVTAVAGVAQRPGEFFMGATGGGVWKTTDFGESWQPVSDGFFETGSIGAIRVAPSNPDVVYVGTGSDGLRSNVITGRGVYKSTDAGATWTHIGLRDVGQIGAVEIHPENPDVVFVAAIGDAFQPTAARGVYRTDDGGAHWKKVLFVSETCGAVDVELAPDNPRELYACMWRAERKPWTIISGGTEGGVYKSRDGGESWQQLTEGLPDQLIGKSDLAVSLAAPDRVYVLMEASDDQGGLYRSDDRGRTFRRVSDRRGLLTRPFYYTNVDADPSNADVVYVNATGAYKSTDGGEKWGSMRTPHGDNHDIWIHPADSDLMIQSNDGGANVSRDGGKTWSTQSNQPTAELYQVNVDDRSPYWLYAGQQDNSTLRVPSARVAGFDGWESVGGCETGPVVPKPGDADIVYANCKGQFGVYYGRLGRQLNYYVGAESLYGHNPRDLKFRFQRVAPIHVSPHDRDTVYHCSQFVHRTRDEGVTWETISPDLTAFTPETQVESGEPITRDITGEEFYSTIYAIAESPLERGTIWVGANDGPIHVTRDDGGSWTDITPSQLPPGGRVQTVEPSPHNPAKAYVAVLRYQLGDWRPHVYRTTDYGASWTLLTTGDNGIPADSPTRVVREDPLREGLLYVGTEFGMWVSFDDGAQWQSLQLNLPATPVTDLKVVRGDLAISTMGRSFWVLDDVTPLRQLRDDVATAPAHLFSPRPAVAASSGRFGFMGFGGRRPGSRNATANVPAWEPSGAVLDYYLKEDVDGEVAIEILDAEGKQVARMTSSPPRQETEAEGEGGRGAGRRGGFRGFRGAQTRAVRLETTAGHHRVRWDMRGSGRMRGSVAPGSYTVTLTAAGATVSTQLEVLIDPKLAAEGITAEQLRAQSELVATIAATSARADAVTATVREARKELADAVEQGDAEAVEKDAALAAIEAELVTERGTYMPAKLSGQLRYLSGMLSRGPQPPGNDAFERHAELHTQLEALIERLTALGYPTQ